MTDDITFDPAVGRGATDNVVQSYAKVWPHMQVTVDLCALALTKDRDLQQGSGAGALAGVGAGGSFPGVISAASQGCSTCGGS